MVVIETNGNSHLRNYDNVIFYLNNSNNFILKFRSVIIFIIGNFDDEKVYLNIYNNDRINR